MYGGDLGLNNSLVNPILADTLDNGQMVSHGQNQNNNLV